MKRFALLITLFFATAACAQSSAPPQTLNAANQCARIGAVGQATVGIQVVGTWSGTLQPEVSIQGQTPANTTVAPAGGNAQSTITANGVYFTGVAGYNTFLVCMSSYASGSATVYLNALAAGNTGLGGGLSFQALVSAECNAINAKANTFVGTVVSSGAVVTQQTLGTNPTRGQWQDTSSAYHDLWCVTNSSTGSFIVSPTVFEVNAPTQAAFMIMTNGSGVSRRDNIYWRSGCAGCSGALSGGQTDFKLFDDVSATADEDMVWEDGGNIPLQYFTGNCPQGCAIQFGPWAGTVTNIALTSNVVTVTVANGFTTSGPGSNILMSGLTTATYLNKQNLTVSTASSTQFTAAFTHADDPTHADTGTASAVGVKMYSIGGNWTNTQTNPLFSLVAGHVAHGPGVQQPDNWGTLALSGGGGTYSFNSPWANAPLCVCNNPNQSSVALACSASASTTVLTIKSGVGSDTVNYSCMGNPY